MPQFAPIVIVMGVAGSGKTTVGKALAQLRGCAFADADEFHSAANIAKMRAGTPLDDADRHSWLLAIAARIGAWRKAGSCGVVTCSALKRAYRDIVIGADSIGGGGGGVRLVYLQAERALIARRLRHRRHHFMPASLLGSQFDALEEPGPDERPIILDAGKSATELVAEIDRALGKHAVGK